MGATPKKSRDGSEMVLVEVDKEFWGPKGLALVDRRSWVFRPPPVQAPASSQETVAPLGMGTLGQPSSVKDVQVNGPGEFLVH